MCKILCNDSFLSKISINFHTNFIKEAVLQSPHISVLLDEVLSFFKDLRGNFIDCTLGYAGHSSAILSQNENLNLIACDKDIEAVNFSLKKLEPFGSRVKIYKSNFSELISKLSSDEISNVRCILADIGVSSLQIDKDDRGFSIGSSTLDMRMDIERGFSAYDVVNGYSFDELVRIFRDYGELKNAAGIANKIINARNLGKITSAKELANIIGTAQIKGRGVSPAILAFQAIRIEVNGELDELTNLLDSIEKGGFRDCLVAIITFHSLEDRIVKERFKKWANSCICPPGIYRCECGNNHELGEILTKKPLTASQSELAQNSRSKSAKLRVFKIKG